MLLVLFALIFKERFKKAMELVGGEFTEAVSYFQRSWLPAKQIVEQAISSRHEVCLNLMFTQSKGLCWV